MSTDPKSSNNAVVLVLLWIFGPVEQIRVRGCYINGVQTDPPHEPSLFGTQVIWGSSISAESSLSRRISLFIPMASLFKRRVSLDSLCGGADILFIWINYADVLTLDPAIGNPDRCGCVYELFVCFQTCFPVPGSGFLVWWRGCDVECSLAFPSTSSVQELAWIEKKKKKPSKVRP